MPAQSKIDVGAVVTASLAIADAEGFERLTMRRLAEELGVTPMAIYSYVDNKERLINLVSDESLSVLRPVDLARPWDTEVRRFFLDLHHLYLSHPSLAVAMAERPLEGRIANELGNRMLALLTKAGFSDEAAVSALINMVTYTMGMSLYRISRKPRTTATLRTEQGGPVSATLAARLRPHIEAAAADDRQFLDGLERLVDSYRR